MTLPCSARWSRSGATWSKARLTRRRRSHRCRRSSAPRASCTASPSRAGARARSKASAKRPSWRSSRPSARSIRAGICPGITTGLDGFNSKIGGLHRSDLLILAGRPGMGKSSLATNMAFAAAQRFVARPGRRHRAGQVGGCSGCHLQPGNVGRPACYPYPVRGIGDQQRESAHGQDQPAGIPPAGPRRGRPPDVAAVHRRHPGPDHRRAAHPRAPPEAAKGHRHDRDRLPPAAPGIGRGIERQSGPGNLRDQPRPQAIGQGA